MIFYNLTILSKQMCVNGYYLLITFQWKFWHCHWIYRPQVSYEEQHFGNLRTFSVNFSLDKLKSFIFLFPVYLAYWCGKCVTRFTPHDDNFNHVWCCYDYLLLIYSIFVADTSPDLVTLTFDLLILRDWSYMAGRVLNLSTKFEDPKHIRS